MKYKRSILRGYDRATEKIIAKALGMKVPKRKSKVKHVKGA